MPTSEVRCCLSLLCAVLLGACTLGPSFEAPHETLAATYTGATTAASAPADAKAGPVLDATRAPEWQWWQAFGDAELDRLEARAVSGNLDLEAALMRIVEARAEVMIERAQGLPHLSGSASVEREQLGLAGILKSAGNNALSSSPQAQGFISELEKPVNLYQVGFDASWELDLFGKVRRSVEAAKAQSAEAIESRNDALVSLEAEVAQTYLQLRAAQALRDTTIEMLSEQREVLALNRNRQQTGLGTQSTVESNQAQLSSAEAELPQYDQTILSASHALAVLTGQEPNALNAELLAAGPWPGLPHDIPVGVPSTLLRRRPDIRAAEAALHAATAQVGISVASMFPDVSLSGTFGLRNTTTKYLFNWASHFYTIGPSVSVPIFDGGALVGNVRLAKASEAEAALNYKKTVLSALQEVEDGLTAAQDDALKTAALRQGVSANQRAETLAYDAYRNGLATYITVLDAKVQTRQAEAQLSQALLTQSTDLVHLYKALGGGWQSDAAAASRDEPVGTLGSAGVTPAAPPLDVGGQD